MKAGGGSSKFDSNLLTTARNFRQWIYKFRQTSKTILSFNEEDTEVLHISKEVDRLSDRVDTLQTEIKL